MDSLITAAALALAAGDPSAHLKRVALARRRAGAGAARHCDGAARRPRSAKTLLRRAARGFGPKEAVARAQMHRRRSRDRASLARPWLARQDSRRGAGDARKAWRPAERRACTAISRSAPAADRPSGRGRACAGRSSTRCRFRRLSRATHELAVAGIAMRRLRTKPARTALDRASHAARRAGIPAPYRGGRQRISSRWTRRRRA